MVVFYVHFKQASAQESCLRLAAQCKLVSALYVLCSEYVHAELSFPMAFVFEKMPELEKQCVYHTYDTAASARVSFAAMRVSGYYNGSWENNICGTMAIVRTFDQRSYRTKAIQVDDAAGEAMLRFAAAQIGKPLHRRATDVLLRPGPSDERTWYCVELTVAIMHRAGLLTRYLPRSLTADALLAAIDRECATQPIGLGVYSLVGDMMV
jgi:hypothetical protein